MMRHLLILAMIVSLLCLGTALGEGTEVADEAITQEIRVHSVTLDLPLEWVLQETEGEAAEGLLMRAVSLDTTRTLTVFTNGEGGRDEMMSLAATNDYNGTAERLELVEADDLCIQYAAGREACVVYAYLSAGGEIFTVTLSSVKDGDEKEALAEALKAVMQTARVVMQ